MQINGPEKQILLPPPKKNNVYVGRYASISVVFVILGFRVCTMLLFNFNLLASICFIKIKFEIFGIKFQFLFFVRFLLFFFRTRLEANQSDSADPAFP